MRLASVLLDKIVDTMPRLWQLDRLIVGGFDPDTLNFRQSVALLSQEAVFEADIHWRLQADSLVYDAYNSIFALEELEVVVKILRHRIGLEVHDACANRAWHGYGQPDRVGLSCGYTIGGSSGAEAQR